MPDITFVIVAWNSAGHIAGCLRSILDHTREASFEVVVVDNGSGDDTVRLVRDGFPRVRLLAAGANLGFPRGCNLAVAHSTGRHVFLLNPDAVLENDAASILARFLDEHPDAGAVGPKILEHGDRAAFGAAREFPSAWTALFRMFGLRKLFPRHPLFGRENLAGLADRAVGPTPVPCLSGAALMAPRALLENIGPLDETLPMYLEDMDVCARVGKAGRTAWYLPGALVRHPGGQCSRLSPVRRLLKALEEGQAPWLLLRLYQGPGAAARYAAAVLAGSLFRSGACLALLALARLTGRDGERLEAQLDAAKALLVWSLSPKKDFHRRLDSHFADRPAPGALDGLEAPEARQ